MVAIKVAPFKGMMPAVDATLLADSQAATAHDAWVYSGVLQPMRVPVAVKTLANPLAQKAFRLPRSFLDKDSIYNSDWLEFTNPDTDVVRSPLANDAYERYYWAASTGVPQYNTAARIRAGSAAYNLGVIAPILAPTVSPAGGVSASVESRAYCFTYVTSMGEESAPSPSTVVTGKVDDTWTIGIPAYVPASTQPVTIKRIYRTVTSSIGIATYFFVADIAIATTSYADTIPSATVSGNAQLKSLYYTPPPSDLQGMIAMPNGMIAGWRNNEVWFCEPYLPHAWPVTYTLSLDYIVVGLGVVGQTLIACTAASPYAITGVNPSVMSSAKIATVEPCLSRGSIVSAPEGVYYASQNGVVRADAGIAVVITSDIATKDQWLSLLSVPKLRAARLGTAYYCFGSSRLGFVDPIGWDMSWVSLQDYSGAMSGALIDMTNTHAGWMNLSSAVVTSTVFNDPWSGEVLVVRGGVVYLIDVSTAASYGTFLWRSKKFQTSQQKNLGAYRIFFTVPSNVTTQNPVENTTQPQPTLASDQYGLLRVYADGVLVVTRELRKSGEVKRLPSGFKADYWEFEIEARVVVNSLEVASSPRELKNV